VAGNGAAVFRFVDGWRLALMFAGLAVDERRTTPLEKTGSISRNYIRLGGDVVRVQLKYAFTTRGAAEVADWR